MWFHLYYVYTHVCFIDIIFLHAISCEFIDRNLIQNEPRHQKTVFLAYAKTKTQISFTVTAKLISAFVFTTRIVQSLFYLNLKFQVSSHLLWLYSPVCVGPGWKPRRPVFSQRGSNICEQLKFGLT